MNIVKFNSSTGNQLSTPAKEPRVPNTRQEALYRNADSYISSQLPNFKFSVCHMTKCLPIEGWEQWIGNTALSSHFMSNAPIKEICEKS